MTSPKIYGSSLVENWLKLSEEELRALPVCTLDEVQSKVGFDCSSSLKPGIWTQVEYSGYLTFAGYSCYESVDSLWPHEGSSGQTVLQYRYFCPKKPQSDQVEPSDCVEKTEEAVPKKSIIEALQIFRTVKEGERYRRVPYLYFLKNDFTDEWPKRQLHYGYHRNPVTLVDPEALIYFGRPLERITQWLEEGRFEDEGEEQLETVTKIKETLRSFWDTSPLVERAQEMFSATLLYSLAGYMSKNNYVNYHHVWWPLVAEMKQLEFTDDDIDRTWVYLEGMTDPVDFSVCMARVIRSLMSSATLVPTEQIPQLPDDLEKCSFVSAREKTEESEVFVIRAQDLADLLCQFINPIDHFKIYLKVNQLIKIEQFRLVTECRDLSFEHYKHNRYADFRPVLRNIMSQFYSDNSAFDYPTKNPALKEPYDDRDCYSTVSMDYYREPCIHGSALVMMADGSVQPAEEIIAGMEVKTMDGSKAKVKLVIETEMTAPTRLVRIGKFLLTPAHPIWHQGRWILPKDHPEAELFTFTPNLQETLKSKCVYSFVLERGHIILVYGIPTICLAHGLTDPVIQHDYLGTERVLKDLAKFPGYEKGKICLKTGDFVLYPETGKVQITLP